MEQLSQQQAFNKLAEALGSPFAASNYLAKLARKLLIDNNNQILQSQAITWALTGEKPKYTTHKLNVNLNQMYGIDDILCYIDDKDIHDSVEQSYEKSLKAKHLIYFYSEGLNEYDKGRVRILLRLIWFNEF